MTHMDCTVEIDGLLVIYGSVDGRTAQFWRFRSWSSCHTARLQAIDKFEETRVATLERKRAARKYGVQPTRQSCRSLAV